MMKRIFLTASLGAMIAAMGMISGVTGIAAPGEWTKIVIKEAFISRQTSIDFRDSNSAPEFGWHIMHGGMRIARGNSLYATMYVPFPAAEPLRLVLVELDVFSDDIVSGVDLEAGKSKYVLNRNGDFVVLERTQFFPDWKSDDDNIPEAATRLTISARGSVSFLDGDYTDCYRLPEEPSGAIIVGSSPSLSVDAPAGCEIVFHPRKKSITAVTIAVSEKGGETVRLRGAVAGGRTDYRIMAVPLSAGFTGMFLKSVKCIAEENTHQRTFLCRDMARALLSLDRGKSVAHCAGAAGGKSSVASDDMDCLCEAVRAETKTFVDSKLRR